ncbi:MAG: response regulator transcription factor [Verrucomicrobiota bacterium]
MSARQQKPASHLVAIVEDRDEVREHWARLLDSFDEFNCPCTCASAEEALERIPALAPEIVLMDIFLPGMSGIECTARLKQMRPATRILILTASDDEEMVFPALEAGADGYLLKHSTPAALRAALLDILDGGVPMTSGIARRVAEHFRKRGRSREEIHRLSPREKEIIEALSMGYSNKEIADKLSLSVETIRSYLKNVYEKMHVRSRAEAVAKYMGDRSGPPD